MSGELMQLTEIKPRRGWASLGLVELWEFRDLLFFLTIREIKGRYRQMALGPLWIVLKPFITMVVLSLVFGSLAKVPSDGIPYPLFSYAALLPWTMFSVSVSKSATSLVSNMSVISKVYFPRLIVPTSSVIVSLVDFCISLAILALLMLWYGFAPDWRILALPLFFALAFLASFGCSLWLAALNVKYRDFRYVVPFIVQFGLYISPVGFSSAIVPEKWKLLYSLNPMVGVIDGFRWGLLGGRAPIFWNGMLVSALVALVIFFFGLRYFRNMERNFADVI